MWRGAEGAYRLPDNSACEVEGVLAHGLRVAEPSAQGGGEVEGVRQGRRAGHQVQAASHLLRRRELTARGMRVRAMAQLLDQTRSSPSSTSSHTPPTNSLYREAASYR